MHELEKQNSLLIEEADRLLHEYGLLRIVKKYGTPFVTGSYVLGLMTWRDLDISFEMKELTEKRFFRMGGEIASALKPWRMAFRNEFLRKTPGLPLGYYYGVHTTVLGEPKEWKIDIWAIDAGQVESSQRLLADLQAGIDKTKRLPILEIKNRFCKHPRYQNGFNSVDIYDAVIKHGIRTAEEFWEWLKNTKEIDFSDETPRSGLSSKEGR